MSRAEHKLAGGHDKRHHTDIIPTAISLTVTAIG